MANLSDFLAGTKGGGNTAKISLAFKTSTLWTCPFDMDVIIHAQGPSGSGAVVRGNGNSGHFAATGAGAGGYVRKRVSLKAGQVLDIGIGARANGITAPATAGQPLVIDGNDGGDTTISGPGIAIVAGGGRKGVARFLPGATGVTIPALLGGLGGSASGGDFNSPGGRGGNVDAYTSQGTPVLKATGGGAPDYFGIGETRGGDHIATTAAINNQSATGGGGLGGNGGDISSQNASSSQGGTWPTFLSLDTVQTATFTLPGGMALLGVFRTFGPHQSNGTTIGGPGAGVAGVVSTSAGNTNAAAAKLAGSGGGTHLGGTTCITGGVDLAGGSGGSIATGAADTRSGQGGAGFIILELLV